MDKDPHVALWAPQDDIGARALTRGNLNTQRNEHKTDYRSGKTEGIYRDIRMSDERE